ncbi:hypothetical protein HDU84_001454 [Entophlyctis sp. JEL0112]|nr:hypothetical protein HDU84_001454 [Entophlyctis sp. JEL0112]
MGLCGFENITVPDSGTANTQGTLQASVVGVSIEFFAFPQYFNASMVPTTQKCLQNLKDAANGNPTNIRIGGTTQDRAQYDPNLTVPVNYTVSSATAAPMSLTYGPLFIELAASISGKVTLGLNRELANLKNTISAAKYAVSTVPNLVGIELGNEPEFYGSSAAIANGSSWTTAADAASQISWQASLCTAINKTDIIQAGVFLQPENGWSIANLAPKEVSGGSLDYVSSFGEHGYPQSACSGATTNLTTLMLHSDIVSYTKRYIAESAAARAVSKDFYISETNSATCGGGGISPTFGAALWVLDYAMQSIINGAVRLYFHHGTLGNSPYSWWGESYTYAPFYGAYFATLALADMTSIQAIDGGTTAYASYGLYKDSVLSKILLYNSDLYSSGNRSFHTFNVQFNASTVDRTFKALRLSAPSATSLVESAKLVLALQKFIHIMRSDPDGNALATDSEVVSASDSEAEDSVSLSDDNEHVEVDDGDGGFSASTPLLFADTLDSQTPLAATIPTPLLFGLSPVYILAVVVIGAPFSILLFWAVLHSAVAFPPRVLTVSDTIASGAFAGTEAWTHVVNMTQAPHPYNSEENLRVRAYVDATLRQFKMLAIEKGLPTDFITFGTDMVNMTSDNGVIWYESNNILVKISAPSPTSDKTLLLSAHFDTQTAANGVTDNAISVAVALELVRSLIYNPPLQHHLVINFNNGEELFLLGAGAFTLHPWFKTVSGFINLDGTGSAPGTRSILFRTNSLPLLNSWKLYAPYPHASIIFNDLISFVPSDTDYRVYVGFGGLPGIDIAFYSFRYQYHTPDDNIQFSLPISAQHLGDNVLAAVIGLCNGIVLDSLDKGPPTLHPITDTLATPDIVYYDTVGHLTVITGMKFRAYIFTLLVACSGWLIVKSLYDTFHIGSNRFLLRKLKPTCEALVLAVLVFCWVLFSTFALSKFRMYLNPGVAYGSPYLNIICICAWVFGSFACAPKLWPRIGEFLALRKRSTSQPHRRRRRQHRLRGIASAADQTHQGLRPRTTLQSALQMSDGPPLEKWLPYGILCFWVLLLIPAFAASLRNVHLLFFLLHWTFFSLLAIVFTEIVSPIAVKWWREQLDDSRAGYQVWHRKIVRFYEKQIWGVQLAISSFIPSLLTIEILSQLIIGFPSWSGGAFSESLSDLIFASFQMLRKAVVGEVVLGVIFCPLFLYLCLVFPLSRNHPQQVSCPCSVVSYLLKTLKFSFEQTWNISTAESARISTVDITFRSGIHAQPSKIEKQFQLVDKSLHCKFGISNYCNFTASAELLPKVPLDSIDIWKNATVCTNSICDFMGHFSGVPGSRTCSLKVGFYSKPSNDSAFAIFIDPETSNVRNWMLEASGTVLEPLRNKRRPTSFIGADEVIVLRREYSRPAEDSGIIEVPFLVRFKAVRPFTGNLTVSCYLPEVNFSPAWHKLRDTLDSWVVPGPGRHGGVKIVKTIFFAF